MAAIVAVVAVLLVSPMWRLVQRIAREDNDRALRGVLFRARQEAENPDACAYCLPPTSRDPNDICSRCWDDLCERNAGEGVQ